jgi:hypothetical protein
MKHDVNDTLRESGPDAVRARHDRAEKYQGRQANGSCVTLQSVRASSIQMTSVDWIWPDRFAFRKLGLLVGLPDEGKGQVLSYIAARVTSADDKAWPCNEGVAPLGNVILLTAEDDLGRR